MSMLYNLAKTDSRSLSRHFPSYISYLNPKFTGLLSLASLIPLGLLCFPCSSPGITRTTCLLGIDVASERVQLLSCRVAMSPVMHGGHVEEGL